MIFLRVCQNSADTFFNCQHTFFPFSFLYLFLCNQYANEIAEFYGKISWIEFHNNTDWKNFELLHANLTRLGINNRFKKKEGDY